MAHFQRGWLRAENRKQGPTWVLRYNVTREADGRRVEHTLAVGLVRDFPSEGSAWLEVERQHLQLNQPDIRGRVIFAELAEHYIAHELRRKKSHTTVDAYFRNLRNRLIPRWGKRIALSIQPLEIERWLESLGEEEGLENPTLDKLRRIMSLVYRNGQRYGLIPRNQESNPLKFVRCETTSNYEALIISVEQTLSLLQRMRQPERTLTLLVAATGLRISESLGLQWQDVDWAKQLIYVRRTWVNGQVGVPKTKTSKGVVPLHPLLANFMQEWRQQTPYPGMNDWVFASDKLHGKQPRVANMLVADYLRPAAVKAGVLVEDDPRRFGFHNLRHSLASFLVRTKTDPKTVQSLLRHSDVTTTLNLYAHSLGEDQLAAQGEILTAILRPREMVN
jgi:integrase